MVLATTVIGLGPGAAAASASTCPSGIGVKQVPSPNPGGSNNDNQLSGVAMVFWCRAWAVGSYFNGTSFRTLIEHWNGTRWKHVTSPNPGGSFNGNFLLGVAATSAPSTWAVGSYFTTSSTGGLTLAEHWNGTRWMQVPTPNPGASSGGNGLTAVAATSATNAWAVGSFDNGTAGQTLILHWNGTRWRQVPSPNPGGSTNDNELFGVAATSAKNAWAAGDYVTARGFRTLILHWNGTRWRQAPSPNPVRNNSLESVAATSATNAWAVGSGNNGNNAPEQTLILHWNGTRWKRVPSPNPAGDNSLHSVAATSSSNAWAVGGSFNGSGTERTLIAHWNGTRWKRVSSPNNGSESNELDGVAATSATKIWAVGFYNHGFAEQKQTLILHCC